MKFAVGYQLSEHDEQPFADLVAEYREHIAEVYFPWLDNVTGRGSLADNDGYFDWSAQDRLVQDLIKFKAYGIRLDLLFNGNCYGDEAMSVTLGNQVASVMDYLMACDCMPNVVTTASPAVAYIIKIRYPDVEVRASVNMRIGTVKGMAYMANLFDSFYIQRDYNRDFAVINTMKEWADQHGKGLFILANSGCMSFCSCQTFHDNAVAHNSGIAKQQTLDGFMPHACWNYLRNPENHVSVLQNTWIRPEDIHYYNELFPVVKLATRMHQLPGMVIDAYVKGRYYGNLLDLFEPGFGPALAPYVIDNSRFPDDWFETTSKCDKQCHKCDYCADVLKRVSVQF